MSIMGIILMWVCLGVVYAILNAWPMGKESDHRQAYWARFEGK